VGEEAENMTKLRQAVLYLEATTTAAAISGNKCTRQIE